MTEPVVGHLDEVWSSIEELCSGLTPAEWRLPTDVPVWTVQDHLAHICGIESRLLGQRQPDPPAKPWPAHVRNEMGALNEAQIEPRRSQAPEDVLTEFLELTAERLKILAELTPQEWAADAQGALGVAPMREVVAVRLLDCFYHEQDMRRAVGKPGGLDTGAAEFVVDRLAAALPMVVAKRAGINDGATVLFKITGPIQRTIAVGVDGGRGAVLASAPGSPTTTMRMDVQTFLRAMGGRDSHEELSKHVVVDGNATFANQILAAMPILP